MLQRIAVIYFLSNLLQGQGAFYRSINFRHVWSGLKCLDTLYIDNNRATVYDCHHGDNQQYFVLPGSRPDSIRISPMVDLQPKICFGIFNTRELVATSCDIPEQDLISFRMVKFLFSESRFLLQNVYSLQCLKPDRDNGWYPVLRDVPCNPEDEEQHFVQCSSGSDVCYD